MSRSHRLASRFAQPRAGRVAAGLAIAMSALLAGCVTPYGGYPGSGYPGGSGYPDNSGYPGYGNQRVLGTVQQVDLNGGRIVLSADTAGYGGYRQVEVHVDPNTRLYYQGREQSVEGLERGDRISVDASDSGGRLWARSIEVVHNVRDSSGGGHYGGDLRGTVGHVDSRARFISLTRGGMAAGTSACITTSARRWSTRAVITVPRTWTPAT